MGCVIKYVTQRKVFNYSYTTSRDMPVKEPYDIVRVVKL